MRASFRGVVVVGEGVYVMRARGHHRGCVYVLGERMLNAPSAHGSWLIRACLTPH